MNFKSLEGLTIVKVQEEYIDSVLLTMSNGKSYRIDAFIETLLEDSWYPTIEVREEE